MAAYSVAADSVLSGCNSCITLRIVSHTAAAVAAGTSAMDAECSRQAIADGTVGEVAIIRSPNLENLADGMIAATWSEVYFGATDEAQEGYWRWWKTGELFYVQNEGDQMFCKTRWNPGSPDNWGGSENYIELVYTGKWYDLHAGAKTQTLCMFQPQRTAFLSTPTTATSEMTEFGIVPNRNLFEIQPFPIHYSFANASSYCRNRDRADPFTGANISGQLAPLRSAAQSAALRDLIFGQTDIPFHTTTAGFGVWLGRTKANAEATNVGYEVTLQSSAEDIMTIGVCDNLNYCNFSAAAISASWPSSGAFAMQVKDSDPTWMIQNKSYAMPFACSYEYSLLATINATSLDETLQNSISNAEMTMFLSFGDHVDWLTAKSRCAVLSRTNSANETSAGELAAIFSNKSNAAITALANAASYGDRSTNASSFGLWVGASTDIENPSTASHSCNLRWNYSSSATVSKPLISSCSGLGNPTFCASSRTNGFYCNMDSASTSSGWPQTESRGLVVAIKQNPSPWTTLPVSQPLPYVCSFRFIFRQNITQHLSGEIHTTPRTFDAAATFCGTRQIGKVGDKRTGVLTSWGRRGWGSIVRFAMKHPANDNPVWIGDKDPSNSSRCRAVYPQNTSLAYFPCSTELPHICLFIISYPSSKTRSHSVSAKRTRTISMSVSSSPNLLSISSEDSSSASVSTSHSLLRIRTSVSLPSSTTKSSDLTLSSTCSNSPESSVSGSSSQSLIPPPPPYVSSLRKVYETMATTSSLLSVAAMSSTNVLGAVRARSALLQVSKILSGTCGLDEDSLRDLESNPGDVSSSPTRLKFKSNYLIGRVIGNIIVILGVGALSISGYVMIHGRKDKKEQKEIKQIKNEHVDDDNKHNKIKRSKNRKKSFQQLVVHSGAHGLMLVAALLLLEPTLSASATLIISGFVVEGRSVTILSIVCVILGWFVLLVVAIGKPVLIFVCRRDGKRYEFELLKDKKSQNENRCLFRRCIEFVASPTGEWSYKSGKERKQLQFELARPFIEPFTDRFPKFIVIDIGVIVALSLADVIPQMFPDDAISCWAGGVAVCFVLSLHVLFVGYLRPLYSDFLSNTLGCLVDVLSVSAVAGALNLRSSDEQNDVDQIETWSRVAVAQSMIQMVMTVLQVIEVSLPLWDGGLILVTRFFASTPKENQEVIKQRNVVARTKKEETVGNLSSLLLHEMEVISHGEDEAKSHNSKKKGKLVTRRKLVDRKLPRSKKEIFV